MTVLGNFYRISHNQQRAGESVAIIHAVMPGCVSDVQYKLWAWSVASGRQVGWTRGSFPVLFWPWHVLLQRVHRARSLTASISSHREQELSRDSLGISHRRANDLNCRRRCSWPSTGRVRLSNVHCVLRMQWLHPAVQVILLPLTGARLRTDGRALWFVIAVVGYRNLVNTAWVTLQLLLPTSVATPILRDLRPWATSKLAASGYTGLGLRASIIHPRSLPLGQSQAPQNSTAPFCVPGVGWKSRPVRRTYAWSHSIETVIVPGTRKRPTDRTPFCISSGVV